MAFSFGSGGKGIDQAAAASSGKSIGQGGNAAGKNMSMQDMLAQLSGIFGGGQQQQQAQFMDVNDPGAASAALLAQLGANLPPATIRRPMLGLGRR